MRFPEACGIVQSTACLWDGVPLVMMYILPDATLDSLLTDVLPSGGAVARFMVTDN